MVDMTQINGQSCSIGVDRSSTQSPISYSLRLTHIRLTTVIRIALEDVGDLNHDGYPDIYVDYLEIRAQTSILLVLGRSKH